MKSLLFALLTGAFATASLSFAGTITFESAPTGVDLGNFYQGIDFGPQNQATGQILPYFPAHSGMEGLSGSGTANTLSFKFAAPQSSFSFYYISYLGFTATAYSANGTTIVGSFNGIGNYNTTAVLGNPATYSQYAMASLNTGVPDISSVVLTDRSGSSTFTFLDDLSAPGITGVPAPDTANTLTLLGVAAASLWALRQKFGMRETSSR